MKKILILIFFFLFIAFAGFRLGTTLLPSQEKPSATTIQSTGIPTVTPPRDEQSLPQPGLPVILTIPSLQITTSVESVGLDAQKRMDVPKNAQNVAWYNLGIRPGEKGNAVMAGHYDNQTGQPAVFYNLSQLQIGDIIRVTDTKNNIYTFIVTKKQSYPFDQVPLQEIFGAASRANLNLITCEGVFNKETSNYSQRTVIYATLQ